MPNAQGRITIRRRPKNGEDGSDAVNFRFIPSASSIVLQKDGTLRPSALSARLVKNEGGLDIDMISQAFDGYTVLCHIKKSDGNNTSGYTPGTSLNLTSHASTLLSVDFELHRDSKVVASISVPCIPAGIDGEDVYLLDLDNEVQGIPCNSSGTPTGTGTLASTNSTVYKGSKVDTGWTFSKTDTNCTSSIDANGKVSVTAITADNASVKVTATKGTITREAVMSLYKVKAGGKGNPGDPGASPVVYSIETSVSAISRDANGSLTPSSMTAYKQKTVGTNTARTTEKVLKCLMEGASTTETIIANAGTEGSEISGITDNCTAVVLTLYDGTTILDKERIPVVKDGTNGIDGEDAISILVSPENIEFNFSKSEIKQTVKVNVYKGEKKLKYQDEFICSTLPDIGSKVITTGLTWSFLVDDTDFYYTFRYTAENDINMTIPFTVTVDNVGYDRAIFVHTVKNGIQGPQGIQGCVYRRSKHVNGFEYHNDSALTTDGIRYIDLVYIMKDSTMYASHALWFRCKKTHTSIAANAPQKTNTGNEAWLEYWEPMNTLEPLYTPFLLADDAVITLMQSNQILIANDEGVITAGMSGSLAGSKIRIWAGSQTPDSAPFRVDVNGKLISTEADIKGKITATSGTIAGFNISGTSLTNGPEFTNDACIIFRNDTHNTFAGIGGNVLPATSGNRAVARFENEDSNNFWGLGRNIAMLLSAKNGDINHAFLGSGNGNLDGWIGGYKFSYFQLGSANTVYNGYLKIWENNKWIVYAVGSNSSVTLPTLTDVRNALGIGSNTDFCIEFIIVADLFSQQDFKVYGRTKLSINNSTPYFTGEYPVITNANGGRVDSVTMGKGDSLKLLLIYDAGKTGTLDTDFTVKYTARIINQQY